MVESFTKNGIVTIIDLHWNDDDLEQQPMALKADGKTGGSTEFWESVASKFGNNDHVFYELYNEPHMKNTTADLEVFMHGNDTYTGMLEMSDAVRKYSKDSVLVIAGS